MNLKLICLCLFAAALTGCESANTGVVLCPRDQIMQDYNGSIMGCPLKTKQTRYKVAEAPTLVACGYGGRHLAIEVVDATGNLVSKHEDRVPGVKTEHHDGPYPSGYVSLRHYYALCPLTMTNSGSYAARIVVDGQLTQTIDFEME